MAYNQSFQPPPTAGVVSSTSSSSNVLALGNSQSQKSSRYGDLSSSGAGSWVIFSPSVDEEDDENEGDEVLSTTNTFGEDEIASSVGVESEEQEGRDDDDDDSDSLIDSLDTAHGLRLSLPTHDGSGNFMNSYPEHDDEHLDVFNESLSKEEFITTRIDSWRREQAKLLIEELHHTDSPNSLTHERSHVDDLLASWGVDDRDPINSNLDLDHKEPLQKNAKQFKPTKTTKDNSKPYKHGTKRFFGDDIFENYSEWEVSMIKKVAKEFSSSLVRDRRREFNHLDISLGSSRSRRSSLLSNLSKNAMNKYLMNTQSYFWQKDLSSAHSSISTTSMMFGNSWGDVM